MLTDKKIPAKLEKIEEQYNALRFQKIAGIPMELTETREYLRDEPKGKNYRWHPAPAGTNWGDSWVTGWFRGDVQLPASCKGQRVWGRLHFTGEAMLVVDGEHCGVFDCNHPYVALTHKARTGQKLHIALEAYAGHTFPRTQPYETPWTVTRDGQTFGGFEVALEREDVSQFVFDLRTLRQLVKVLDENSLRRAQILKAFSSIFAIVDAVPTEGQEANWRPKLADAIKIMRPLLEKKNGTTAPHFGIIGHSHIDTAWLWPLAETWRKCARTFGSNLNLMEQYPEYMFLQSSPCQTEMIRQEYPGIFKRLKKMVAEGRWEPNGGMWVEPDCNIPSGEAFVRQVLVAQQSTREMFGYNANTLWMPDVFGYSAALPQILKGCGVDYFCTTKIGWNDTTRFPFDTFWWKGIDGTRMLAHFNVIHCWPDAETFANPWNWVQHKDVQDRRLLAYGFGDGGGGPQIEMIEMGRRCADLEGVPRTHYTSIGGFMQKMEQELTDLPEYVGELYLELHRGTLTSIAKIKRGNRQAELAMRDAEMLATLARLRGVAYPSARLLALWKNLLTNQFHDILPGSSIQEVNDEAIAAFAQVVKEAREITDAALSKIAGKAGDKCRRMMIVNTLGWDRAGELVLEGAPKGCIPAVAGIKHQWIENVEGKTRLALEGLTVPALAGIVVDLVNGKPSGDSPFKFSGNKLETPYAVIRFDKAGRIVSLLDKPSCREVVRPGGALNSFLFGEDVPAEWDNWDIDSDQRLKMDVEDRLLKREVAAEGPLQLRLRSHYKLGGKSTILQDMVFHATSPRIDFETIVDWHERRALLKAAFELNVFAESARHEIQYGHAERPTHQNLPTDRARFEVCAHKWTDISEGNFGVALLNDSKYGISVQGSELGLSLIKAGVHPDARAEEGRHLMTYSLLPHAGGYSAETVVRPAYELNVAPVSLAAGPAAQGFAGIVAVDAANVIVETIKWAEDGGGFIVRLYEAGKCGGNVTVTFHEPVASVSDANLLEEDRLELNLKQNQVKFFMRPFEIKTLYCKK